MRKSTAKTKQPEKGNLKILYAIQGTGNGHLSRAMDIIPMLKKKTDVDVLLSGTQSDMDLPFKIKYRLRGMSFIFGKNGGVDLFKTYLKANSSKFLSEIRKLPVEKYDLVITDFEPVSAWAARLKGVPCAGLSNQCASLSPFAPKPKRKDPLGKFILKKYVPTDAQFGYHFIAFAENIFTPIIRQQVRELQVIDDGHYAVYLPAHDDEKVIKYLSRYKDLQWEVFSKHHKKAPYSVGNIHLLPINNDDFLQSLASCKGIITAAGFGTTSEALFLNKKLLVIPMNSQYEQHCNAAVLKSMGVTVMKKLKKKHLPVLEKWLAKGNAIPVDYPDITEHIIDTILHRFNTGEIIPDKKRKGKLPLAMPDVQTT